MIVASVRKRLVYASINKDTVGNNRAGVVRVISMAMIISPLNPAYLNNLDSKTHKRRIYQHHRGMKGWELRDEQRRDFGIVN